MRALSVMASCLMTVGTILSCASTTTTPSSKPSPPPSIGQTPPAQPASSALPATVTPGLAAGQPRSGGTLTIVGSDDPPSYDVHQEANFVAQGMLLAFYNGLVQYDPTDREKIIPDLAENWETDTDGKTLTFNLRKGVSFHDGRDLTPADVKLSLDRLRAPPQGVISSRAPTLAAISEVQTLENKVKLSLKYPSASLLAMLAVGQIVIYPKHVLDAKGNMKRDIVGTGPYKFKQHNPGSSLEAVKNTKYFIPGRPYLDGITFFIIRDAQTRTAAFRTGRVKLFGGAGPGPGVPEGPIIAKEVAGAQVISFPGLTQRTLLFNAQEPPWNDVRLRRAASLAIDRRAAVKSLAQGSGEVGGYFVPGTQYAAPPEELAKLPGYREPKDVDIAEAKALLAEAGFPNGLKAKISASATLTQDLAVFLADQLAKVNISAEIEVLEHGVFTVRRSRAQFSLQAQPPGLRSSEPLEIGRFFIGTPGGLEDKKMVELFDKVDRTLDIGERRKIAREIDLYLMAVVPSAIVYHRNEMVAIASEVRNYRPGLGWYNNNKYQDSWLAK